MLLRKHLQLESCDIKLDGETGKFSGYASVFGGVDSYGDTILSGAFDYTLRTNGKPKMFLEHAWVLGGQGAAALPIGKFKTVKEDAHGLLVDGELTPGMSLSNDVSASMKHGTIDGLSIGGYVKAGDYDQTDTGRVIRRWTKLLEISVVSMPADRNARIDLASVKHEELAECIAELESIRDFERFLRDAGGFSKGLVTALTSRAKAIFAQGEPVKEEVEAKGMAELHALLHKAMACIPL